jgi:hypothetical protein
LIARELFWWVTGRKYGLRRVVERGGEKRLSIVNLKMVYGVFVNLCSDTVGREGGQKRELRSKKSKLL